MRGKHASPPAGPLGPIRDLRRRSLRTVDLRAQLVGFGALGVAIAVFTAGALTIDRAPGAAPAPADPVDAAARPASAPPVADQPAGAVSSAARLKNPELQAPATPTRRPVAPSPRPTAPRTPELTIADGLQARYVVSGSWDTGFVAGVVVFNPTGQELSWRVEISHARSAEVQVVTHWNADITRSGSFVVFAGGPLPPGGIQTFGFEALKKPAGPVRPSGCTVNGTPCEIPE